MEITKKNREQRNKMVFGFFLLKDFLIEGNKFPEKKSIKIFVVV